MINKRTATVVFVTILMVASLADVAQPVSAVAEMGRVSPIVMESFAPTKPEIQEIEFPGLLTADISTGESIEFLDAAFIEMSVTEKAEIEAQAEMEAEITEEKDWQARVQAKAEEWEREIARQEAEAKRIAEAKRRARARARARRRARIKARREEQKKKELDSIRNFYWNWTQYSDVSKNLGISKKRFQKIIEVLPYDYVKYFKRNAGFFWKTAKKYNLNEFLLIGICAWESHWGEDPINENNFSSQRIGGKLYYSYETAEEGIEVLAKNLAVNYLSEDGDYYNGKTLADINIEYCETNDWSPGVCNCMKMVAREYLKTIE